MPYDKLDELYDALKEDGAVSKSRENFRGKMLAPGKEGYQNRLQLYNALKADGAVSSPTYEDFSKKLGIVPVQKQQAAPAQQQQQPQTPQEQKPSTAPAQAETTDAPSTAADTPKATPLSEEDKRSMLDNVGNIVARSNAGLRRTQNRMDFAMANAGLNVPRTTIGDKNSGVKLGQNTRVVEKKPQYNPETGKEERTYITESGNEYANRSEADLEQNMIDEEARQPLGIDMDDKQVEAAQKPVNDVAAAVWKEAEAQHKADREKNAADVYGGNPWLHAGREMRTMDAAMNAHKNEVSRLTRFDIQKMMDSAWGRVGEQMTASCYDKLKKEYPTAPERQLQMSAEKMAHWLSDNAVYKYAVAQHTPKSALEFFAKTAADTNLMRTVSKGLARSEAGTTGDMDAEEAAMAEYGKNHRIAQIGGTVTGMMFDPTTYMAGFIGSGAGKLALGVGGRMVANKAGWSVGSRLFGSTLKGRVAAGVAGGAANFGAYEGIKEGENQFLHGGHINQRTGENEGYSAGEILSSTGHGLVLGAITGTVAPMLGNVADKWVKATSNTAGKVGIRTGELATSTIAEGTIFSAPEWIANAKMDNDDPNKRSAWDVWTDNMAMMLGFKAQHMVKSAPKVIAGLRPVADPKTMQERNQNRMSFMERLRKQMDASPSDMAFSKEEREELQRYGYGDLATLFTDFSKRRKTSDDGIPYAETERGKGIYKTVEKPIYEVHDDGNGNVYYTRFGTDEEKIPVGFVKSEFDGYEEMERLMQDPNVSQSARAKAYYILTGRQLPMGTVTGYTMDTDDEGNIYVKSVTSNGEVVTNRRFADEASAKKEQDKIMRQAELNSVDVGERYAEAKADDKVWEAAIETVAPGADVETVKRNYQAVKEGDKDAIANYGEMMDAIDKFMEENRNIADGDRPEAIRKSVEQDTDVNVDSALKKEPGKRTEAEQEAVQEYLKRLFPEQKAEAEQPMSEEQANASAIYEQSRLLWGKVEQGDAEAKADVDAIGERMKEAYSECEDAFGADAEMRMAEMEEDPWALVNNPELSEYQQDAVLNYINAKAAMDGVQDASNDAMENKRKAVAAKVERHTHKDFGTVQPATMKVDDRKVYVVKGNVVPFPDGTGIDVRNSDQSVIVCDAETGEYKFTSPDMIFNVGDAIDPQSELDEAYAAIEAEHEAMLGGAGNGGNAPETPENAQQPMTKEQLRQYAQGAFDEATQGKGGIAIPQEQAERMQEHNQQMLEQGQQRKEEEANSEQTALSRVPINKDSGEPMFEKADKETALDALNEVTGGNEANTTAIVSAQVEQAQKALDALKKKKPSKKAPTLKGSAMEMIKAQQEADASYNAAMEQYNGQVAQAEETLGAWSRIYALMNDRKREAQERQNAEQRAIDARLHEEAVAQVEEQKRMAAEKAAEQKAVGAHTVNPKIREKWDKSAKVKGNANALTLADGSTLRGHYVLTEAGAASASHDISNAFEPTEGFPVDENGESVNDRDYRRDKDAQQIVRDIARNYDSRALQSPVIVSKDGVVLSGNNRTMSGDMAAQQGTDKAYIDHLREFGQMYGFTPEQIDGMEHPRVVFVPDEELPYDAATFARFNAETQKKQSKPEQAVKLGKVVPDNVFASIVGDIGRYDRLSDYYADDKAVASAIGQLQKAGVINEMQLPEMRTGNALSAAGRELIENTLIGKVFQTSPDAVRQIIATPTLRQSVVMGLNEIAHNRTLAKSGYDLSQELGAAVDLVARAKAADAALYKEGMPVSPFGRQQGLFDDEYGDSRVTDGTTLILADILNSGKPSDLRKFLATYNNEAQTSASGQMDMFSGKVASKEELLNQVNEYFRNATPREQQATVDAAIAERKRRAEAAGEVEDGSQRSGENPTDIQGESDGGVSEAYVGLNDDEADELLSRMEAHTSEIPQIELNPTNWIEQFGENGMVATPIGKVKMGENQIAKLFEKGRGEQFGMIKPTLEHPHAVIEVPSESIDGNTERASSLLFIKTFKGKDGKKVYYFKSVTVKKDGLEVSVSSHYDRAKRVKEALKKGKLLYRFDGGAQTERHPADVSVTTPPRDMQGKETPEDGSTSISPAENQQPADTENISALDASSIGKDRDSSSKVQEKSEKSIVTPEKSGLSAKIDWSTREEPPVSEAEWMDMMRFEYEDKPAPKDKDMRSMKRYIDNVLSGDRGIDQTTIATSATTSRSAEVPASGLYNSEMAWFSPKKYGDFIAFFDEGEKAVYKLNALRNRSGWLKHVILTKETFDSKDATPLSAKIEEASAKVNINPTEAQKEAGNYKKGHVQVGTFDITIEQPEGSVRKGTDADGKKWESKMHNAYGYFRGTEGVDGDHIDVFLSNDIDGWNGRKVFVVDQYNPDGTFDEHKVMLGFNDKDEAKGDYLANYEKGWEEGRRIDVSEVNLDDFEKWIDSSHRKTKPFAEYAVAKKDAAKAETPVPHPELGRSDKRLLMDEGKAAYQSAATEVSPLGIIGKGKEAYTEEVFDRFKQRYKHSVGDYIYKMHEPYLREFFEYFEQLTGKRMQEGKTPASPTIGEEPKKATDVRHHKAEGAEPLTHNERVLRDAVVDRLNELNGIPTSMDVEQGQKLLDMANGEARLEAKHVSARKQWINNYVDAMSVVTGRDKKELRNEIEEKVAEARRETAELYENVLSGKVDDVTLQQINDYIDHATNQNRYYRPLSQRLPERALLALQGYGRTNAVDALYSRICESTVAKNGRTGAEGRRSIEAKKEELLEKWAKATGHWHETVADFTDNTTPIKSGTDSDVYLSNDGKTVIKASKGKFDNKKHPSDIDQVALFNTVFPQCAYRILGYGRENGKFVKYLEQNFVDFSNSSPLTTEERVDYMHRLGFEPRNDEKTVFSNGRLVVSDLQKSNVVRDKDGNVRVIDADVKLHTRDIGGEYTYPDVETDLPVRLQKTYHGSGADFDHFDHSHMGEGAGSQVFGWGTYVTSSEKIGKGYAGLAAQGSGLKRAELESNISRAQERLPFLKGEYKTELENEIKSWQEQLDNLDETKNLYEVDIPDDNGKNYLDWDNSLSDEQQKMVYEALFDLPKEKLDQMAKDDAWFRDNLYHIILNVDKNRAIPVLVSDHALTKTTSLDEYEHLDDGSTVYRRLKSWLDSDKDASKLLSKAGFTGIKYKAGRNYGAEEGDVNYVIFNEADAKITDHVRFFRTADGEAYGFTVGGQIFVDPRIATSETPVHEYAHLWAEALRKGNPKEWKNVVELMKGTSVWDEVKKRYPELKTDDEIADEVIATYSGRRGAERLREEAKRIADGNGGVFEKAEAISALERVKRALADFWKGVCDFLHIHFTSAEEVADRVMKDMLDGVDPRKFGKTDRADIAERYGLDPKDVEDYEKAMRTGHVQKAHAAMGNIRRTCRIAHTDMKLLEFKRWFNDVEKELYSRYGNLEELQRQYEEEAMKERSVMEAARKKAEEEQAKRQKRLDELSLLSDKDIDKQYMEALNKGDETTAREMLDEAARRKGYGDASSDYQGVGAWAAPSNPRYDSDEDRRADIGNSPDMNLEDMALGYSMQSDDYFDNPRAYMNNTPHGRESSKAIQDAIDAIHRGEKDVKVRVYRAVPTSVKEGKLRNGDWVTPSRKYAEMHGNNRLEGKYRIIEDEVPANELWWDANDANEFGFDDGKDYRYKNTKNNRKLDDLVTRDDKGDIIPPSKRFNSRKADIRYQFVGERGAERADHAEEVTTRLDNLKVAREMEEAEKDAKAIKMATGWERGADGKWRYEIPDAKMLEEMDYGRGYKEKRDTVDILWTDGKLGENVSAPALFKAYPELKDVRLKTDDMVNDMPSHGEYSPKTNTITIHADELKYLNSILNHEIQHAIQHIEGFARGGNPEQMERDFEAAKAEWKARAYAHELEETAKEMGGEYNQAEVEKAMIKEYEDMDMLDWLPDKDTRIKGFNYFARGYADRSMDDAIKRFRLETSTRGDFNPYMEYRKLSGEVEARNVQKRMGMSADERRRSLASETEDVAREDQIFLYDDGGESHMAVSPSEMSEGEKARRGTELAKAHAVDVKSGQIVKTESQSARKAAEEWWSEHIGKPLHYDTEVGQVEINSKSIGTSLAHRYSQAKLDAITSLKDGFGNAVYLGTIPDFIRTRDNVQNHYFAYPINYEGKRSYVFCRAMEDNNKNRLYVHEVFIADNIQNEGNTLQTAASKPHGGIALYKSILSDVLSAAKVAEKAESAKTSAENVAEDNTKFRLLDESDPKAQELEALPDSELVPVYRNVQAFEDDALGSPMAFTDAETGERRTLQGQKWNYSNPPQIELTDEQQRQLDELNKNGYIVVDGKKTTELRINDGLKFVKPKTKDAQLQYFLKKNPEDKGLWAAYDPYDHAIETPLNTQFGEAYKRPNLVVVRSLIPKSEIAEPYQAPYALLPTGAHQWNNGRTLYLSRWSKIDKVLTREEEAKLIDEYWKKNPGKREALKSHRDYNRFVPQVRRELEKMGYRFELDGKELTPEESLALDKQNWENRDAIPGREGHTPFISNEDIARINAKMSGKWVGEPKAAMESAMTERVNELSERLHTPVRIVRTEEEVAALPSVRQRRMKGSFNPVTGEVTIVVPNNANVADVENTFVHEVVGHDGLRVLFPEEEKLNNALDELYRVSSEGIQKAIDRTAQKMYDAEVDRIRERKRKEHEAKGEDTNASYYADMAEAHVEASKKREKFRRDATEEYGADLAGRIGEEGFEKMSAEELTFWGKLKAMLQKALQRLLNGLNIPGTRKWTDKDWAFVLHEAYKRKKNGGKPDVFDMADTEVMQRKTGFGDAMLGDKVEQKPQTATTIADMKQRVAELFEKAKTGEFTGKPQRIGRLSANGKAYLEKLSGLTFKENVDFVLNPSDLNHIRADHYGENEKDKGNNVPLTDEDIRNMVDVLNKPDGILYGIEKKDGRKLFFFLKDAGNGLYNLTEVCSTKKGNLTAKSFFKSKKKGISQRVMEIKDSLLPTSVTYSGASLSSAAKIPTLFEIGENSSEKVSDDGIMFRDGSMGIDETITNMKVAAMKANADNWQSKQEAMKAIGGNLSKLRQAMARQREYDYFTVRDITALAKVLLDNGLLDDLSKYETKRILTAVTNANGKKDTSEQVDKVMNIMVNNQLRMSRNMLGKLLSVRGSRVDARGIEVQGKLDTDGQTVVKVFRSAKSLSIDELNKKILEAEDRMANTAKQIAANAAIEHTGLLLAKQYVDGISENKKSENQFKEEIKKAKEEVDAGQMTEEVFKQFKEAVGETIKQLKVDRIEAYNNLTDSLGGVLGESVERAKQWKEAEKERVNMIHHLANSDMQGRELKGHRPDTKTQWVANSWIVRFALEPLSTFDQMLKMLGSKNPNGEGYMQNYFMRHWVDSTDNEQLLKERYQKQMDDKASEIFGKKFKYLDLYGYAQTQKSATVKYYDGAGMREYEIPQDGLLYLYAVEKMPMGKATNRRMGITDEVMARITDVLDPKLKEYADWVQEEFLPSIGMESDAVYTRMFGTHMDSIENYFPFVRDKKALKRDVENGQENSDNDRISVQTGAIKKRVASVAIWNLKDMSFFDVLAKHVSEMSHWMSFAELNRDIGTLLSYNRLQQQVENMSSAYGAGEKLWKRFETCAAIATGCYKPKRAYFDRLMVQGAKGVTMGKISFRVFTALKQTLSLPAFFGEVNAIDMAEALATGGIPALKWSWKNMPNFRKRILSRTTGDYRLRETEYDGKIMKASTYGMIPNIAVDAWTIAVGSYCVYKAQKRKYLRWGMDEAKAEHRAIQDAELCFNKSQQSSEGAYLAPIQVDHTLSATSAMLFRNSSTSYTRETHNSARNLKRIISGEVSEDFVTKQILRTLHPNADDYWSEAEWAHARKEAKREIRTAKVKNGVNLAMFGWILPWLWRIGGLSAIFTLSRDSDEKAQQFIAATKQSAFAPLEGLTYGDVFEGAINKGLGYAEQSWSTQGRENPMKSDIKQMLKEMDADWMRATNDVLNILGGMVTGVNPQTFTDWVVAIMDFCGDDAKTSRECALLVARLLNCPQSQLDKVYFEELDMTAAEASKLTPSEVAERYARYKMMREAPLTGWMRSSEQSDSISAKKQQKAFTQAKEKLDDRVQTEETRRLLSAYDEVAKQQTELSKLKGKDNAAYVSGMKQLIRDNNMARHMRMKRYKHDMKLLTEKFLNSKSAAERDSVVKVMFSAREKMLNDVNMMK